MIPVKYIPPQECLNTLTDKIPKIVMLDIINKAFENAEKSNLSLPELKKVLEQAVINYELPNNVVSLSDFRSRKKS